ncbi:MULTISPECIES: hypothetical protein [Rhizobium]|uniref:Uncharacterized protein n=1 Tax=Rhizobium paranaense TaxID=1650438 RepID=A0A7W8XR48_9HYPH|nr:MULTISPECIES: hypothetical protein [Rhizobium]MBB5574062.1 hypothetical protein [Rhizobium paranaense]PST61238.1 hypothetical protein C9E91_17580 [Rhizobium sp. SEMIA4064]
MQNNEMTMSEVLRDPMIRQMLRADRVSLSDFATLLKKTARARNAASAEKSAMPLVPPVFIERLSAGGEAGL